MKGKRFDNSMARYAIAFDMNTNQMKRDKLTDSQKTTIYQREIVEALKECGFTEHPQGSLYHTPDDKDPIIAIMKLESILKNKAPNFCKYANRIHVFRMEEWSDITELITGKQITENEIIDFDDIVNL